MDKPLATILIPTTANETVGQCHLINKRNEIINGILNQNFSASLIFYAANNDKKANFEILIKIAENTKPYIIIIEEMQRMNLDRQDLLLQYTEEELKKISNEDMSLGLRKIITNNSFFNFDIRDEILEIICNLTTGDLRKAINILGILTKLCPNETVTIDIINGITPKAGYHLIKSRPVDKLYAAFGAEVTCQAYNLNETFGSTTIEPNLPSFLTELPNDELYAIAKQLTGNVVINELTTEMTSNALNKLFTGTNGLVKILSGISGFDLYLIQKVTGTIEYLKSLTTFATAILNFTNDNFTPDNKKVELVTIEGENEQEGLKLKIPDYEFEQEFVANANSYMPEVVIEPNERQPHLGMVRVYPLSTKKVNDMLYRNSKNSSLPKAKKTKKVIRYFKLNDFVHITSGALQTRKAQFIKLDEDKFIRLDHNENPLRRFCLQQIKKKINREGIIQLPAGNAEPGASLTSPDIDMPRVCREFNDKTKDQLDDVNPVSNAIFYSI
ncbi:hypothetical protein WN48_05222 [Eufriesea mexicana]|uniref:Uncharacterized protein n=1 Tax=Eufriesea mexicana TaxID=516756 RepID=A0A310SDL2_9HYME|nr:hypothetical protein WN48_05222 [Eufriesea mexicana]